MPQLPHSPTAFLLSSQSRVGLSPSHSLSVVSLVIVVVVGYSGLLIRGFGELADSFEGLFGSVCCLFAFEMDTE